MTQAHTFRILSWLLLPLFLAGSITNAALAEDSSTRIVRSISFAADNSLLQTEKDQLLQQSELTAMATDSSSTFRMESLSTGVEISSVTYTYNPDFSLFDARSELISDYDHDGFYHRFAITIDADTDYSVAYVYARLYISYEGGPWEHFATSNNYHIYGDSAADAFTIETELADGFYAGYYDIRVELFDADYHHWLLSYGPYDDGSLSALPLEDSYYDDAAPYINLPPYETEIVVAAQGSLHFLWTLLPGLIITARRWQGKKFSRNS